VIMDNTLVRQDACAAARERMLTMLLNYEPCRALTVGDVIWIADWASTVSFDAIRQVDEKEERS
jgi:hypothetical protein